MDVALSDVTKICLSKFFHFNLQKGRLSGWTMPLYSKIYGSRAGGSRHVRVGLCEDWVVSGSWESKSWVPSSSSSGSRDGSAGDGCSLSQTSLVENLQRADVDQPVEACSVKQGSSRSM